MATFGVEADRTFRNARASAETEGEVVDLYNLWTDNIDLIWVETLGSNDLGAPRILMDIKLNAWESHGSKWQHLSGSKTEKSRNSILSAIADI